MYKHFPPCFLPPLMTVQKIPSEAGETPPFSPLPPKILLNSLMCFLLLVTICFQNTKCCQKRCSKERLWLKIQRIFTHNVIFKVLVIVILSIHYTFF